MTRPAAMAGAEPAATERLGLLAALAQLFQALREPRVVALLGPPVRAATLPLGARVPGTSFELEPASAAYHLGVLLHGAPAAVDPALAPALAAADYAARRAPYHGLASPTVAALFAALALARASASAHASDADPWRVSRVAGACAAAALLGADAVQRLAAVRAAAGEGSAAAAGAACGATAEARDPATRERLAAGEHAARALRHALAATRAMPPADPSSSSGSRPVAAGSPAPGPAPCVVASRSPSAWPAASASPGTPRRVAAAEADFAAAIAGLFPPRQVPAILALVADDAALRALPVDALVARLVRN